VRSCRLTAPSVRGVEVAGELKYTVFGTAWGYVGVLASDRGLLRTTLPQRSAEEACRLLGGRADCATWLPGAFEDLVERFKAYFSGRPTAFPDELDLSGATLFQSNVWRITRLVPYGETRSYSWLAGRAGKPKAARAVGQALAGNPLPVVVPCHRVIAGDGGLGGFSGGLEVKRRLLRLEAPGG